MSSSDDRIPLEIPGAGALTEIRLLNSQFEPLALGANTGTMTIDVTPGIYELGYKLPSGWTSQTLIVRPDGSDQPELPGDLLQINAARSLSGLGIRSGWIESPSPPDVADLQEAVAGLVVRFGGADRSAIGGRAAIEATLTSVGSDISPRFLPDVRHDQPWILDVPAGTWLLTIGTRHPIQLPLTVCQGWSTRCHVPLVPDASADGTPVAIDDIRIRYRRLGAPIDDLGIIVLEEEALAGLTGGRALFGAEFEALIDGLIGDKAQSPILGILAGYLCAGPEHRSRTFFRGLIDRLGDLLCDAGHPDLVALEARYRLDNELPLHDLSPLRAPPSLLIGWRHILEASARHPGLVGPGSFCERISSRLWSNRLWTTWSPPDTTVEPISHELRSLPNSREAPNEPAPQDSGHRIEEGFDAARQIIVSAAEEPQLRDWLLQNRAAAEAGSFPHPDGSGMVASFEELAVANAIRPLRTRTDDTITEQLAVAFNQGPSSTLDSAAIAAVVGLAKPTVERAAAALAAKLLSMASDLGVVERVRTTMEEPELIIPYDPRFLGDGFVVPMPTLRDSLKPHAFADGAAIDYTHYSLVMRKDRRIAVFTANNVDAAQKVSVSTRTEWKMDSRVGAYQIGPETYDGNSIDKGHLVRREDVLWGTVAEARAANKATFFYTNAAPQHENFNQDEWKKLEDWVLTRAAGFSYRLCVFTGPIVRFDDPRLEDLPPDLRALPPEPAQLPYGFWKVIVLRDAEADGDALSAIGFAMKQSDMWTGRGGSKLLKLELHQVPLTAIEDWAEIDFGALRDIDELSFDTIGPRAIDVDWPLVQSAQDLLWPRSDRRRTGQEAVREARSAAAPSGAADGSPSSDCCSDEFDAKRAVSALSRDVARLTQLLAQDAADRDAPSADGEPADGSSRNGLRSLITAPGSGPATEDERLLRWTDVAPAGLGDEVDAFGRHVTRQGALNRGELPPEPVETLRIVGGSTVRYGEFPDCVLIGTAGGWMCTGVVIAPQVVLTAAHCGRAITRVMVNGNLGTDGRPSPGASVLSVRLLREHPGYRRHPHNENDVTLLVLDKPAGVPPVRIAREVELGAAVQIELVGFGYNDPQRPLGFGEKRRATIAFPPLFRRDPTVDFSKLEQLTGMHADYEFLAGRKALGIDSCNGDSGGPAYVMTSDGFKLAGLTSRATRESKENCGDGGIYVRPDRFLHWIGDAMASAGLPPI